MPKKNNKGLIILIIIIVVAMAMGGKKEAVVGDYYWSLNSNACRLWTSFDGVGYLSEPAPQYTTEASCLAANNGGGGNGVIGIISGVDSPYALGAQVQYKLIATNGAFPCTADITIVPPTIDIIIDDGSPLTSTCVGSPCRNYIINANEAGLWEFHIYFLCSDGSSDTASSSFIVEGISQTCTDTDGQNFKNRGSVTYDTGGVLGEATVWDVCLNDGVTLVEQVCTGNTAEEIQKNCQDFGSDWSCESINLKGACVQNIVVTYTYQCLGANSEIGYTASTGGGLVDVGTCGSGKECADLFKGSSTILSLEDARNLICQSEDCVPDNSCATNTCKDKTCVNTCGTTIPGTKDCEPFDFNKYIPWIVGFFVFMIGIKMLGKK